MLHHLNSVEIAAPAHWKVNHIALALLLGKMCNARDECWPSLGYLADVLHLSRRQVIRLVADLEADGCIKRMHRPNQSTVYLWTLGITLGENVVPLKSGGDTHVTRGVTPMSPLGVTPMSPRRDNKWSGKRQLRANPVVSCG